MKKFPQGRTEVRIGSDGQRTRASAFEELFS
jgi:hypothetical protein